MEAYSEYFYSCAVYRPSVILRLRYVRNSAKDGYYLLNHSKWQTCPRCYTDITTDLVHPVDHLVYFLFFSCHSWCRLSYSKNGVIRIDGFSSPDQHDEEALSLWAPDAYEENDLDMETSKYILSYIGDKFCQLVMSEKTAATWIKKDGIFTFRFTRLFVMNSPV